MALLVPNEGEVQILNVALGKSAAENLTLKLFSNNYTPTETDTSASYTEVTGYGYTAQTVTAANWTIAAGAPSTATAAAKTFSFTGAAGNVYGYYLVGATSAKVYWAERFTTAPIAIQNNGDQIIITLTFGLD